MAKKNTNQPHPQHPLQRGIQRCCGTSGSYRAAPAKKSASKISPKSKCA